MLKEQIIIIGNGPAGCSAAVYAARAGLKPRVFAGDLPCGLLTQTSEVENFPGFTDGIDGLDLVMAIQMQAEKFGAVVDYDTVTAINFTPGNHTLTTADGREFTTPAIIIATGAAPRFTGVPGEERLRGRGVSACATCDGAFFKGVPVVVAGGGDSAMEEALFLTRFASHVHLVHRRDTFRASAIMVERARAHEKITFHLNSTITEITGNDEVDGVLITDKNTNATELIPAKGFFAALGHTPSTALFKAAGVATDDNGYIIVENNTSLTNIPGVFAAGDCMDPRYRQASVAAGNGVKAALDAEKYLADYAAKQQ